MGKCLSKNQKYNHQELKQQFTLQMERKKEKRIKRAKTEGYHSRNPLAFKRTTSKTSFQVKDFICKNYNSLMEEYRWVSTLFAGPVD